MRSEVETILETDHTELDRLLSRTFRAIDSADCREAYLSLDYFWARLAMHIRAEHLHLFPAVRGIAKRVTEEKRETITDGISKLLDDLRHDHDFFMVELARAIKALRLVFYFGNEAETLTIVKDIVEHVKQRLFVHNEIEESRIYSVISDAFLTPEEMNELRGSIIKELANLPARFRNASAPS